MRTNSVTMVIPAVFFLKRQLINIYFMLYAWHRLQIAACAQCGTTRIAAGKSYFAEGGSMACPLLQGLQQNRQ